MTVWIVLLRWLEPVHALAFAGAAILLNWVVLPLTGLDKGMRRQDGPWVDGAKLYPVAVFLVLWMFPMPVAAASPMPMRWWRAGRTARSRPTTC